jgi:putrescine transport system permease protein
VLLGSDPIYLISYLKSLEIALVSTAILLLISYRSPTAWRAPRRAQRAVLFMLVVLPFWTSFLIHLCLDQHPAARRAAQSGAAGATRIVETPPVWLATILLSTSASSIPTCRSWCCRSVRCSTRSTRP